MKEITSESFQSDVIESPLPVLVDVYAQWCAPCRLLKPRLMEIEKAYEGRASVVAIDYEINKEIAKTYKVESLPTIFIFSGGEVVKAFVGIASKEEICAAIDAAIG